MKTDLITKGAAVKAVLDWMDTHKKEVIHKQDIADVIMGLPSEEKTGKWVDAYRPRFDGTRYWYRTCTFCGWEREDCNIDKDTPFCPTCGARMVGE